MSTNFRANFSASDVTTRLKKAPYPGEDNLHAGRSDMDSISIGSAR
jgi:hypothetical protein